MSNPNQNPIVTEHEESINTLTEWSNEELSPEDEAALMQLAEEEKAKRETDGYREIKDQEQRDRAAAAAATEAKVQQDNNWRQNPDAH